MPRFVYRRPDEEIVQTAAATLVDDDDGPPLWARPPLPLFRAQPQIEDDTPLLTLTLEEDSPLPWRPVLAWSMRVPLAQDAEDVGTLGLALDDEGQRNFQGYAPIPAVRAIALDDDLPVTAVTTLAFEDDSPPRPLSQGTLMNLRPFPVEDDLPVSTATLAYEDEAGPLPRALGWPQPPARLAHEDDAPMLYGAHEEDSWKVPPAPPSLALAQPRPPDNEDAPTLHGVYEEDRWLPGVPPRSNWLWWPPQPDGDWTPVPPGTVPPRASLQLFPQNRQGLALQRIAAMQLGLLPSGRLGLALVRSGPSQLSLSPVGRLSLSLSRSG